MICYYFKMTPSMQYICFCVVTLITALSSAEDCVKINSCSCKNSSGVLDLSPLESSDGEPAFKDHESSSGSYYYSWNPCTPFTEDPTKCANVSGCRTNMAKYESLGTPDSAQFVTDNTKGLMLQYSTSGLIERHLDVILVCDPSTNATLSVKGEIFPTLRHEMTLRSKYCCLQSNDTSTTESSTPFTDSTPSSNTSSSSELPSGSTESSSGSTESSSGSTMPASGSTNPDTGSTNPASGSTNPNTGSTNPNTGSTNPASGSTNPATGSTNPATGSTMTTPGSAAPSMIPLPRFIVIAVLLKVVF